MIGNRNMSHHAPTETNANLMTSVESAKPNEAVIARVTDVDNQRIVKHGGAVIADGRDDEQCKRPEPVTESDEAQGRGANGTEDCQNEQKPLSITATICDGAEDWRQDGNDDAANRSRPGKSRCHDRTRVSGAPVRAKKQRKQNRKYAQRESGIAPVIKRPGNGLPGQKFSTRCFDVGINTRGSPGT